eukprot:GHVU01183432.1.p1 GENE.GHVU01183432.1~~GHVU01183432.1.p1  ORF type:complete len:361 (+),score=34.47 GHVU01183432.1:558-1640(+)
MAGSELAHRSDEWDIRINVEDEDDCHTILQNLDRMWNFERVRYAHCSSIEIGDIPGRSSYGKKHVHIALVLANYTSKASIMKKLLLRKGEGWYIQARDKKLPREGWLRYHTKLRTKVEPEIPLLYQRGEMPKDKIRRSVEEKQDLDDTKRSQKRKEWERRKYLVRMMMWDELDEEFPGFIYSSSGQAMKRELLKQANTQYNQPLEGQLDNFIIHGPSGTGKSSSVALLYPNCYKKQKGTQYWDGYDPTNPDHEVVWIDEMSKETLKTLTGKQDGGFEFLKELGDRYPVTVDEKYTKGFKIRPKKIIITMNEHPTSLLPERAVEVNKKALYRKFKVRLPDYHVSRLPCLPITILPLRLTVK